MKIAVIGAGYVGLSFSVALAQKGYKNYLCEINPKYLEQLSQGRIPIYENQMDELYQEHFDKKTSKSLIILRNYLRMLYIFLAVGTPSKEDGNVNTDYITDAIKTISQHFHHDICIVIRSTVPVGYSQKIENAMRETHNRRNIYVVFTPEFLREGSALNDTLYPQRLVIGQANDLPQEHLIDLKDMFLNFVNQDNLLFTDRNSAELSKYASNVFLAMKIGFINEISRVADYCGANVNDVKKIMSLDSRIGKQHLNPSLGYGGSCFPKDVDGFNTLLEQANIEMPLIQSIKKSNAMQSHFFFNKITKYYHSRNINNLYFGVLGTSFKGGSDDIRESSAIKLIISLLSKYSSIKLKLYDPQAIQNTKQYLTESFSQFDQNIQYCSSIEEVMDGIDALIVATDWNDFIDINASLYVKYLRGKVIFDGRNLIHQDIVKQLVENNIQYIDL